MKLRLMHSAVGEIAFPLKPGGSLIVGRLGSMADVEISWDPRISRRHCRLWEKNGRVWFQDLASRNGSWIGDDRVAGVIKLAPGDVILIGETALLLPDVQQDSEDRSAVEETQERAATEEELASLERAYERTKRAAVPAPTSSTPPPPASAPPADPPRAPIPPRQDTLPPRPPPPSVRSASTDGTVIGSPTVDLRSPHEVLPLAPEPEPPNPVRSETRFVDSTRVKVSAGDREGLRELWMRDISKGGLFVETKKPPPDGTPLDVELETPNGSVTLRAVVVHVLTESQASSFGGQPGVGVQFVDLDPTTRKTIQSYVDGLADHIEGGSQDLVVMSTKESDQVVELARKFLQDAETANFYTALELIPTAPRETVDARAAQLQRRLSHAVELIAPPQAARINSALNVLARVRRILTNEESRLEYDFRHGYIRAHDRIIAANDRTGASLETLRRVWTRVYPDRIDRAALLMRKAYSARQRRDLAEAIEAGRAALELNPFFVEFRLTVDAWEATGDRPAR